MKVYITGISGYVGSAAAAHFSELGHTVHGLVRNQASAERVLQLCADAHLDIGDLKRPGPWCDQLLEMDAVVHLAAQKNGNLHEQLAGTASTTESLLRALGQDWPGCLVLASSFTVYDYRRLKRNDVLTEDSPTYENIYDAGPYSQSKRLQETLVQNFTKTSAGTVVILRVAGIYGRGKSWSSGLAIRLSDRVGVMFAPRSPTKLVHIDNVVSALELAAKLKTAPSSPLNIIDDERPTFWALAKGLRSAGMHVPLALPVPYVALLAGERILSKFAPVERLYPTRLEILTPGGVRESWLPLRYSNERAKRELGWAPSNLVAKAYDEAAKAGPP